MGAVGRAGKGQEGYKNGGELGNPSMERKRHQNGAKMESKWSQNGAKLERKGTENGCGGARCREGLGVAAATREASQACGVLRVRVS